MKAHYPIEYMTAILTAESGDVEKISEIIEECKKMNIPVLPPNINESYGGFTVVRVPAKVGASQSEAPTFANMISKEIRFGFYTIKNLGTDISDAIISERKLNGKYKSISDFLDRVKHKNLNKKSMEALIKSGSMDEFAERGQLLFNLEDMLLYNKESSKQASNQVSLFGGNSEVKLSDFKLKEAKDATQAEKLLWEKELLGLYVSGHPLDRLRDKLEKRDINIKKIKEEGKNGMSVTIAGIIESSRQVITKNNERMAFLKIADLTDSIEAVVFPKLFSQFVDILVAEKCIALTGKISLRNGEKSIIIEGLKEV